MEGRRWFAKPIWPEYSRSSRFCEEHGSRRAPALTCPESGRFDQEHLHEPVQGEPWTGRTSTSGAWHRPVLLHGCSACVVACQAETTFPSSARIRWRAAARCTGCASTGITATTTEAGGSTKDRRQTIPRWWFSPCSASTARMRRARVSARSTRPFTTAKASMSWPTTAASARGIAATTARTRSAASISSIQQAPDQLRAGGTGTCCSSTSNPRCTTARWVRINYKETDWEIVKLVKNPDVTVRMRGVMEKCTFCVQRIEQAKIAVKVIAKDDSGNVRVPGDMVKTACQEGLPGRRHRVWQQARSGRRREPDPG